MLKKIIFSLAILFSLIGISSIGFSAVTCDDCFADKCVCSVSECPDGFFDTFTAFDCSGETKSEVPFKNNEVVWTPGNFGTFYARVYCDNQKQTSCTRISVVEEEPVITETTTTTTVREACPYDCCINEPDYRNRYCGQDQECVNNRCVSITPTIPFNVILIVVAVLIGVLLFAYFFVSRSKREDVWEALKRKWIRR